MKEILLVGTKYKEGEPKTAYQSILNPYLSKKHETKEIDISDNVLRFNPIRGMKFVRSYWKLINAEHTDVALVRSSQYIGLLVILAAKLSSVKKITVCVHGSDWDVPERISRKIIPKYIVKPLEIRMADSIFMVCQTGQKIVKPSRLAKAGANKGVVYDIFPNADINKISSGKLKKELNIPEDKIITVSIRRVVIRKGHQYTIEILKNFKDSAFVFAAIRNGDYLHHYEEQCKEEIAEKRLFLFGDRADVYELLKDSDIFLFLTLNENHSVAFLETINTRCAIIVTNVGDSTETIGDDETGIAIRSKNVADIVSALYRMKDKEKRKVYTQATYAFSQVQSSVGNTLGKLEILFNEWINELMRNRQPTSIATIITCRNRRHMTIEVLNCLFGATETYRQGSESPLQLKLFLTDDGCTDGTTESTKQTFRSEDIAILKGDGQPYRAGGICYAWEGALKEHSQWDYYLLLNSGTSLFKNAFAQLLNIHNCAIESYTEGGVYADITYSSNKQGITYRGGIYSRPIMGKLVLIHPKGHP